MVMLDYKGEKGGGGSRIWEKLIHNLNYVIKCVIHKLLSN